MRLGCLCLGPAKAGSSQAGCHPHCLGHLQAHCTHEPSPVHDSELQEEHAKAAVRAAGQGRSQVNKAEQGCSNQAQVQQAGYNYSLDIGIP